MTVYEKWARTGLVMMGVSAVTIFILALLSIWTELDKLGETAGLFAFPAVFGFFLFLACSSIDD